VWHVKEPSLLKAESAEHRSKFAALSPVMVTVARQLKNCLCDSKQTNISDTEWDLMHVRYKRGAAYIHITWTARSFFCFCLFFSYLAAVTITRDRATYA
jgi:hypothetical protein